MPLVVNTNVSALIAQRHLSVNTLGVNRTLERLSSGYRINRAGDDAAGLQISEKLRSQIRGMGQAISNAQDVANMLSIAEGSVGVINEHFQRIRELTVQAANDTNGNTQRDAIEEEIKARLYEVNRIANSTEYNGIKPIASVLITPLDFYIQIGPNTNDYIDIGMGVPDLVLCPATVDVLMPGPYSDPANVNFTNNADARDFLSNVNTALDNIGTIAMGFGKMQNRLEGIIHNLEITRENYESSESRIRNADIAKEAASLARYQILQQAASSILAQANQTPSLALLLLRQ